MSQRLSGFMVRLVANVNLYQLMALGMALAAAIVPLGMPGGGGGGGGVG